MEEMVASHGRQQPRPSPSKGEVKGEEVYGTANSSQYIVESPLEQVDFWGDGMDGEDNNPGWEQVEQVQ
jgi:hypothetical protein